MQYSGKAFLDKKEIILKGMKYGLKWENAQGLFGVSHRAISINNIVSYQ